MKRISLIILAVAAIIIGSVSCQKVNDLDKRLTELEQTVSDLKAQILAGAVITSVDKTADGCTFTLSNGQSYTVTNGKDGSDGEAIIADVKIEENFIVLTLKNGETLRISYQNPLSMVTLSIVPDFDDGTVQEPNTTEYNGEKSTHFYLDVAVTPAKCTEILSDTERFIHKAVFSPVLTKSGFGNAFTVSPKRMTYCEGAPIPFLEASFELDDDTAALLQNKNTPYTVSYVIEDKDGVHGAATAFVAISHEKGSVPDVSSDDLEITLIQPDKPLPGVFTVADPDGVPDSGDETKVQFSQGNLASYADGMGEWGIFPKQYYCTNNIYSNGIVSLYEYGDTSPAGPVGPGPTQSYYFDESYDFGLIAFPGQGWRMLSAQEWCYLFGIDYDEYDDWFEQLDDANPRSNLFRVNVNVNGYNCVVLYPDNYQGTKNETFTTESDYTNATSAGIVFLPYAGCCGGIRDVTAYQFGKAGYYWSHTNAGFDHVFSIFLSTISDDKHVCSTLIRNYCSVRLVKDYVPGN